MEITHVSDCCTPCWRCGGTVYGFHVVNGKMQSRVVAECCGCKAAEGAFTAPLDPTAAELRIALDVFEKSEGVAS